MGSKKLVIKDVARFRKSGGAKRFLHENNLPLDSTIQLLEYTSKRHGMGIDDTEPVVVRVQHADIEGNE